ncbi:hypothetical protein BCF44_109396 [Kutzneria buriramensis]|uniref:Uncharacterized protein n=1 Tax=Kutzneria buriramensis TaxID=1045776 RepID=A0A3E0HF73_9PSEU|nr:hypothetical protein BCF44_109396 [Kutzneria buriramensis]
MTVALSNCYYMQHSAAHLGDFHVRPRVLLITAVALAVGGAAVAAFVLLKLIGLITNVVLRRPSGPPAAT